MEDYAYVLDYLAYGKGQVRDPYVFLIGEKSFTLLEATLHANATANVGEKLFVGKEGREKIDKIKRKLNFDELTNIAKENLLGVLQKIIHADEARFLHFLNNCKSVSIRTHTLELIPGIGKKNMQLILEEREKKPFESLKDIKERISTWGDPTKNIAERIILELEGKEKHYFFAMPAIPYRRF